jgi:formate dehydrogenase major subunit
MGSFPHELPGYRHISDSITRAEFEGAWGVKLSPEPGLRIPNMFEAALEGSFMGLYCEGEDIVQSDPNTQHVTAALSAMVRGGAGHLPQRNRQVRPCVPARIVLHGKGRHLHQCRAPHLARDPAHAAAGRLCRLGGDAALSKALGYPDTAIRAKSWPRLRLTPLSGVSYEKIERLGSVQWPCNDSTEEAGTAIMHKEKFVRGKGRFIITQYVTDEKVTQRFPLLLTTGRILSQYNVGRRRGARPTASGTARTGSRFIRMTQDRGIRDGDWVGIESRSGQTVLRATVTERIQPGVVYTTFHFPESGANVITTDSSDWATNCPEYKVTAVQVLPVAQPSSWQQGYRRFNDQQLGHLARRSGDGRSVMDVNNLIRMANRIAEFFEAMPEHEALDGVAQHIQKFWEPRMRLRILAA